jgi:alpha-L-fucosidase
MMKALTVRLVCGMAAAWICGGVALAGGSEAADGSASGQAEARNVRMDWWREARFGMFIHWGLYSVAAGEWDGKPTKGAGEWIMNDMKIPLSQYAKLVPQFNPVKFDARAWARTAREAGMKYIVITSKHHEGFGMFHSSLTDWCISSTPSQRDPLKELAEACKKEGIKLGFYYSIMDWHHPDYAPRKSWNDIDTAAPDFDRYNTYMKDQLKELLTGYGPVAVLWFDGQWEPTWNDERGADLYKYVRSFQPNLIVNNRVGNGRGRQPGQRELGDYGTPEQTIPANGLGEGVDWETCMTMNDTWGFKESDNDWKPTQTLVRNLIDCASKGGNYLLNVGPTGEGLIPEASVARLKEVGRWMNVNGEAVYGTTASPFSRLLPWGRCTKKVSGDTTTLYLHVFNWPDDGELLLPGLKNKAKGAWLLTDPKKHLSTRKVEDGLVIAIPKSAPDAISSTLLLRLAGAPEVEPMVILQKADGSVNLPAVEARVHGETARYESGGQLDNIGFWTQPEDWVDWEFKVTRPGIFKVSAVIAALGSGSFEVSASGQTLHCTAPTTGSYSAFQPLQLGVVEIPAAGKTVLSVHPVKEGWQPMNLKAIQFEPAKGR